MLQIFSDQLRETEDAKGSPKLPFASRNIGAISQETLVLYHLHFLPFKNVLRLSTQLPKSWKYFCYLV